MESKVIVVGAVAAAVGVAQTAILRQYVDKAYPTTNIESLGGFGKPSALGGIVLGLAGVGVGYYGIEKRGMSEMASVAAIDYGIAAFTSGIISGLDPAVVDPKVCADAEGFWYMDSDKVFRCHKEKAEVPAPVVKTSSYRQPADAMDMNVLRQMSGEIQRLTAENAAIKAQIQTPQYIPDGSVHSKQAEYDFMAIAPGQPTPRAKEFGFMDPNANGSLTKVQAMKRKYDFLG